MYLVVI